MVIQRLRSKQQVEESDIVILSAALTILILDLSGTLRGESGRILLFLSPWLLFAAAYAMKGSFRLGGAVTLLEGLMAIVLLSALFVERAEFKAHAAPTPPTTGTVIPVGAASYSSGAVFGSTFRLDSYAGKVDTQGGNRSLLLWLTWHDLQPTTRTYDVAVNWIAPGGMVSDAALVMPPMQDEYPTTCWKPADGALTDRIKIPLPGGPTGDWSALLSLIDQGTGQRLNVVGPGDAASKQAETLLTLGPFH
jgi:uncharacterized membrane protein